jgi:DNA polymerase-3 subunit epsilon
MIYDVIPEFEKWIKKLNAGKPELANVIICGQSVINDINFLRYAYRNEKMKWSFSNKHARSPHRLLFFFQILEKNGKQVPALAEPWLGGKLFWVRTGRRNA